MSLAPIYGVTVCPHCGKVIFYSFRVCYAWNKKSGSKISHDHCNKFLTNYVPWKGYSFDFEEGHIGELMFEMSNRIKDELVWKPGMKKNTLEQETYDKIHSKYPKFAETYNHQVRKLIHAIVKSIDFNSIKAETWTNQRVSPGHIIL